MKQMRMTFLSLTAMALLVGPGVVKDADADLRVQATLQTPNVRVRIGNTHPSLYRSHLIDYRPIRTHRFFVVDKRDRKIARRLARFTGVPARKLLNLRRVGYRWVEIGRWLQLPRPVIRAAMHQKSWKRFLRRGLAYDHCIIEPYEPYKRHKRFKGRGVAHIDYDFDD